MLLVCRYSRNHRPTTLLGILLLLDNKWRHCRSFVRGITDTIILDNQNDFNFFVRVGSASGPRWYKIRTFILNKIENNLNIIVGI